LKILFITIILLSSSFISAQNKQKSDAFKKNPFLQHSIFKPKYPSYTLLTSYILQKEAQKSDPFAEQELGLRYLLGRGFKPDTAKAVYWIKKAADQMLTTAKFNYGILLLNGIGVKWNPFKAFKNFEYAAKSNMPAAEYIYGLYFTDNLVVNRNLNEALFWNKKAADAGFEPAKKVVKKLREFGISNSSVGKTGEGNSIKKTDSISTNYHNTSALLNSNWKLDYYKFADDSLENIKDKKIVTEILKKNNEELKSRLGIAKLNEAIPTEDTSGINLVKYAAKAGSPEALLLEGRAYQMGVSLKKNDILAIVNYIRAYRLGSSKAGQFLLRLSQSPELYVELKKKVDENDPNAMFAWAGLIALGFDYRLTQKQAFGFLERAVKKNFIPAMIEEGLAYYSGTLVKKDTAKAFYYWRKAALLGSKEARVRIAFAKIRDEKNKRLAKKEFLILKKTADEGSVLAQTALAFCYENGIGVKQNKAEAARLYQYAAQRGNETAYLALKKMYDAIRPPDAIFQIYKK